MTKKFLEADFVKHMKRMTEGEIWELVKTGRGNVNITIFTNGVLKHDNT